MPPVIVRAAVPAQDNLPRTDWFLPDVAPTIEGEYEARTGGGHVFRRRWTGKNWLNSVTNQPSTAPLEWRGVIPNSIALTRYPMIVQRVLAALPTPAPPTLIEQHDAIGLPFA